MSAEQKYMICPRCGYFLFVDKNENKVKCKTCEYPEMIDTKYSNEDLWYIQENYSPSEYKKFQDDLRKMYTENSNVFHPKAYNMVLDLERRKEIKRMQANNMTPEKEELEFQQRQQRLVEESNRPKCPTCGSTNIRKIPTSKKISGGLMFGLFSSDVRKTFECLNCKYKW